MYRFHQALAEAGDDRAFSHLPVEWWDAAAQRWRPTVVERAVPATRGPLRTHAEVIMPLGEAVERGLVVMAPRRVRIVDLRPAELLTERVAQFFTTRYTLEMLDSLSPCIDRADAEERRQLQGVLAELVRANREGYEAWVAAFTEGAAEDELLGAGAQSHSVEPGRLPRSGTLVAGGIFALLDGRVTSEIACSPVALWDESARRWRPTIQLDVDSGEADSRVLVPGDPVAVRHVPARLLQPIDIADGCFSLFAIPVIARDFLRMFDAMAHAGIPASARATHPFIVTFARMLSGAADEWRAVYDEGLSGPAPEPLVRPLDPRLWGFTGGGYTAVSDDRR